MEKVDLTNYELEKETSDLKFYVHTDNDSIKILNCKDELVAEIEASSEMGYGLLDLKTAPNKG